jgi:hypothetical protein
MVVGLQYSDLIVPLPGIAWKRLRRETLRKDPLPPVNEFAVLGVGRQELCPARMR